MIWVLGVLAYLAVGAVVVRVLGRFEMFEDMVGLERENPDPFYRGMAIVMWLPLAAAGLLLGGLWLLGRLSGAKGP